MHGGTPPGAQSAARWAAAMRRGDFAAAWAVSDALLAGSDPATRDDRRLPYHLRRVWDGKRPDGRDVLVRCYHGLGDVLMAARLLPALRARVRSLTLEVPPPLLPLLEGVAAADRLIGFDPAAPAPAADCDIELMEVAHVLRLRAGDLPPPLSLPRPSPLRLAAGPAIGLCWRVGEWDAERSVPLGELLAVLRGRALVSLQRGEAGEEARGPDFLNPGDSSMDVIRTAALVAGVDLVITVDTMIAHLAAALGTACWVLLKADADWRWGLPGRRSLWYPALRLYRQERDGDWDAPLAHLKRDLAHSPPWRQIDRLDPHPVGPQPHRAARRG